MRTEELVTAVRQTREIVSAVERIRQKVQTWGITLTFLARQLGVSRQYTWQIVHGQTALSITRVRQIEAVVDGIIEQQTHMRTFGDRLRAARVAAGLTLKEVARMIGYTWVGVQRWEKNVCRPKPGVIWHLLNLYGANDQWEPSAVFASSQRRFRSSGSHASRAALHPHLASSLRSAPNARRE